MKQAKHIANFASRALILFLLTSSLNGHSQLITNCGEDFHGVGHAHQDCVDDIVITSTQEEGTEGTILAGVIYSEGKITITPGYSKVRILYAYPPPPSTNGSQTHRTKLGNGGNTGGRYVNPNTTNSEFLKVYPNPVLSKLSIEMYNSNLIKYEVWTIDGRLLLYNKIKETSNYSLDLEQLKSGLHLLKLHLKNGDVIIKQIIKQ